MTKLVLIALYMHACFISSISTIMSEVGVNICYQLVFILGFFDKDKDYFIGKIQSKISNPIKLHAEYMVFKWEILLRTNAQTCHTITGISKIKLDKIGLKTFTVKKKKLRCLK